MVDGSAVVASHFARAASMSVTSEASTRMSSARTMSRCVWEAARATSISEAIWNVSPSPVEPWPLPAWHKKWHNAKTLCWERMACISLVIFDHRSKLCCSAERLVDSLEAAPPSVSGAAGSLLPCAGADAGRSGSACAAAGAPCGARGGADAELSSPVAGVPCGWSCTKRACKIESNHVACCDEERNNFVVRSCRRGLIRYCPGSSLTLISSAKGASPLIFFRRSSSVQCEAWNASIHFSCCSCLAKNSPHCGIRRRRYAKRDSTRWEPTAWISVGFTCGARPASSPSNR
mmetsp:Transcript_16202/g.46246  ORF Transcript_16202/g.46246 Transcript_16202/m.46246 type:complete len:290 (-) Transcript_16202:468-1337(-)